MQINLGNCFPEAADGSRSPLPKQQEFLNKLLDPKGPKYIRYSGGIGSGKTMIGCIGILTCAVMYPGDYLIARLFMPELRDTTLKTFLEICPKELIAEYRVADAIVRIKNASGGVSNVMFRGLEEPDKLRSLNLNAFYIDEAVQVSEEAFLLLQGRLRGKYVRKGVLTSNSAGHSWAWRYFVDKSMFKTDWVKDQFYNIKAPSTENIHLPEGYVEGMLQSWSEDRIKREILADEDSFEGQVYSEFRRDIHVVKPFRIPDAWDRYIRIDHGYRNPAAALYFAVSPEGEVYLYREFYRREWLINEIVAGKKIHAEYHPGIEALSRKDGIGPNDKPIYEKFANVKIDPSTKNRNGRDGLSDFDEYYRCWPKHFPILEFASNDVKVGIDRVKSYLKVNPKTGKPLFFVFDTCVEFLTEVSTYKYPELKTGQIDNKSEPEKPIKAHDHAMDAWRYMIIDLPDPAKREQTNSEKKMGQMEKAIVSEWESIRNPRSKDPFSMSGV